MKLKVCGLTKIEGINHLIALNVDFLGFIFYQKSPRYVLKHLSLEAIAGLSSTKKIGVFVNENVETIIQIANAAQLNLIQLHGDETENFLKNLREKLNPKIQIIKVIRVGKDCTDFKYSIKNINQNSEIDYLLFDTDSAAFGGTGKAFNWEILNEIDLKKPYFLSGGISLENVANYKTLMQKPFALDVNSKFETAPGEKDITKIKNLLKIL